MSLLSDEDDGEFDILARVESISSPVIHSVVDADSCITRARAGIAAVDTLLVKAGNDMSNNTATQNPEQALLSALPTGISRIGWVSASLSFPLTHTALPVGINGATAIVTTLASALSKQFLSKAGDAAVAAALPLHRILLRSVDGITQPLVGNVLTLLSYTERNHGRAARVDAANAAHAMTQKEAAGVEQAFVIGDRVHYSPQWEALNAALALKLVEREPILSATTSRHIADTALVLSRRARCASIALAAISGIVNIPGIAMAMLDAALSPAVTFSCITAQRANISSSSSNINSSSRGGGGGIDATTSITSTFGPCVRIQTPIVIILKTVGDDGIATADAGIVGRFLVVVSQEVSFSASSLSNHRSNSALTFGDLCDTDEGTVRVSNGRVDIAWAPGDDVTSVRSIFLLFEPLQLSIMLRTPMHASVTDVVGAAQNSSTTKAKGSSSGSHAVGPQWGDSAHARAAVVTAGAARALVATASARKLVRAGKGSSATLPQARPDVFFHKDALARVSLSFDAENADALLRALDVQTGQAFADSGWRTLSTSALVQRASRVVDGSRNLLSVDGRPAPPALPVSHTQVFAWGAGGSGQLGVGDTPVTLPIPAPLAFAGELGMWRVSAVACGWHHTVLLTDMGTVYAWGNGGDGQLGVGDLASAPIPRLVDFFGLTHPLTAIAIAAGSDSGGSHTLVIALGNLTDEVGEHAPASMLLDDRASGRFSAAAEGRVFSWGVDPAVGNGAFEPVVTPKLVRSDVLSAQVCDMYDAVHSGVVAVAAGGGFSLALTRSGALYSWGRHTNGRLGLGEAPLANRATPTTSRGRMTAAVVAPTRVRTQPFPMRVSKGLAVSNELLVDSPIFTAATTAATTQVDETPNSAAPLNKTVQKLRIAGTVVDCAPFEGGQPTLPMRSIAAGEAHSLAIDVFGLLWTWGHGGGGALGHGSTRDFLFPRRVTCSHSDGHPIRFASVAAGSAHSLAISTENALYSWGGVGRGSMLGHADGLMRERVPTGVASEPARSESLATELPSALLSRMRARRKIESVREERGLTGGGDDDNDTEGGGVPHGNNDDEEDTDDDETDKNKTPVIGSETNTSTATEMGAILLRESKWKRPWLLPRVVRVLDGSSPSKRVTATGGGWVHSWALTTAGELYTWGDNTAGQLGAPPSLSTLSEPLPRIVGSAAGAAASVGPFQETIGDDMTDGNEAMQATFKAASSILRMSSETIVCAASGGWHMIAVSGGSYEGLMLRQAWPMAPFATPSFNAASNASVGGSVMSTASSVPSQGAKWSLPEIFSAPGGSSVSGFDVRLRLSDGREIRAHRAVLAARSTTLAERLLAEALVIPSRARRVPPVLFLSDLTASVASALLEWIYTDRLSVPLSPTGNFTRLLAAAANAYGIPRLYALCSILLESPVVYWTRQVGSGGEPDEGDEEVNNGKSKALSPLLILTDVSQLVVPAEAAAAQQNAAFELAEPRNSLSSQMLRLLLTEQPLWCDVVFIAGGWRFAAHAVVVCSACEYFRSVLARSLEAKETDADTVDDDDEAAALIEIALPDSAATVMRLLSFMYSGTLPPLPASADYANLYGILPGVAFPAQLERETEGVEEEEDGGEEGKEVAGTETNRRSRGLWVFDGLADAGGESVKPLLPITRDTEKQKRSESDDEEKAESVITTTPDAVLGSSAIAGLSGLCPGVSNSWTPDYQLLCDITAADRYGITTLSTLAASLLQVTPINAAQVLELSDLLPGIPRLREAALQAATRDLDACLTSAAFATLRMRSPQLMDSILQRVSQDHDSAFFRGLAAELATPIAPRDDKKKEEIEAGRLATESISKNLGRFTWQPVIALVVIAVVFVAIAEYNASAGWHIPVINVCVIIGMILLVYSGVVKI